MRIRANVNKSLWVALLALLAFSPSLFAVEEMSQEGLANMIADCKQLEYDYATYRVKGDAQAFANVFTEEGEWGRSNGRVLVGRAAIADYINALPAREPDANPGLTTTVKVTPIDSSNANTVSYALMPASSGADLDDPVYLRRFHIASESRSVCTLTDSGWKIAKREYSTLFTEPE